GPAVSDLAGRKLRRRAGGDRDDFRRAVGEPGCGRGGDRALPAAAGFDPADAAGADAGGEGLAASGAGATERAGAGGSLRLSFTRERRGKPLIYSRFAKNLHLL